MSQLTFDGHVSSMNNLGKLEQFQNFTLKEVKSLTKTIRDLGNPFAYKGHAYVYWIQNTL